jgi:hypothetical protein
VIVLVTVITAIDGDGVAARALLGNADGLGRKLETVMRSGVRR